MPSLWKYSAFLAPTPFTEVTGILKSDGKIYNLLAKMENGKLKVESDTCNRPIFHFPFSIFHFIKRSAVFVCHSTERIK